MKNPRNVNRDITLKAYDRAVRIRKNEARYVASAVDSLNNATGEKLAKVGLAIPKGKVLENLGKYAAQLTDPKAKANRYWGFTGSNNFDANTLEGIYNETLDIDYEGFDTLTDSQKIAFGVLGAWVYFNHLKELEKFGGLTKFEYEIMVHEAYAEKRHREQLAWEKANGITEEMKAREAEESAKIILGLFDDETEESK